ncbi:MAG: zinc-binding alcohol dehydrogenase [Candidatus Promineifilaceae bacterium]
MVEVVETAVPRPAPGQLLVKTHLSAISPGTEMLIWRGQFPQDVAVDETIEALAGGFSYPLVYGYACVGEVTALGDGVDASWLGRRVFAFNPHQSYFAARPEQVVVLPDELPWETAVMLPNMETAVSFLMDARPQIGEQAALFGQGVVGLLTTMLLAQMPMASLVAVDSYPLRRTWAQKMGATAVVDAAHPDAISHIRAALQQNRAFAGADLTFELSGNPAALDMAIAVTGYSGRVLVGSWYGRKPATLHLGGQFHRSHMRLISSQVSHIAPQWQGRWSKRRRLDVALTMLQHHRPDKLITHRLPVTQAADAYALLDNAPETAVQLVLTYHP